MGFDVKKRFIAGAICPKCSELDKIMVYNKDGQDYRECISCGFSDEMNFKSQAKELETRVNKTATEKKAEVQVLQFPPLNE